MKYELSFKGLPVVIGGVMMLTCCTPKAGPKDEPGSVAVSPVEITTAQTASLSEYVLLTAVAAYPQKSYIKANMTGYVQAVNVGVGQNVRPGMVLFRLITKEAKAIGNGINELDSSLKFSGVSSLRSNQQGVVTAVNHQTGDYVQDGEPMAVIINQNSLVFLLDLPYELNASVKAGHQLELTLPDGLKMTGTVGNPLAGVDSLAQTKRLIVSVNTNAVIPEGLVARVKLIKTFKPAAQTVPKSAVLANETEDKFWVMKMINDSTAVKVPVIKGISNEQQVEITNPVFGKSDRIVTAGNYGLADTARVKIVNSSKP